MPSGRKRPLIGLALLASLTAGSFAFLSGSCCQSLKEPLRKTASSRGGCTKVTCTLPSRLRFVITA